MEDLVPDQLPRPSRPAAPWVFFALACLISWGVWVPTMLWLPESAQTPLLLLGAFGPWLAAMLMVAREPTSGSVRAWLRLSFDPRIGWRWYVIGGLGLPVIMALMHHGIYLELGGASGFHWTLEMLAYPVVMVLTAILGGGQEELGWRAYATPRLVENHHPILASAIVGVVWVIWHLPLYATGDWSGKDQTLLWFFLYAIALSITMTWLYFRSHRCVIPVMLLHGATNVIFRYFPREDVVLTTMETDFDILKTIAYWVVAAAIIISTRGSLGVRLPARKAVGRPSTSGGCGQQDDH